MSTVTITVLADQKVRDLDAAAQRLGKMYADALIKAAQLDAMRRQIAEWQAAVERIETTNKDTASIIKEVTQ